MSHTQHLRLGWVEFGFKDGIEVGIEDGIDFVLQCFENGLREMSWRGMIFGLVIVVTPSTLSHSPKTDQILGLW